MEVMVGSSFGIGMAAYVSDRSGVSAHEKAVPSALFLADESRCGGAQIGIGSSGSNKSLKESSEDSSSSIGERSENEEEEEDETVSFQGGGGGGGALDSFSSSLEDSLPIKRGLSNHYAGKSKSFGNLMEASNSKAKDIEKAENPLNKRRRLIIANKLRIRGRSLSASHFYTWQNPNSMPLLAFQEPYKEDHNDDDYEDEDGVDQTIKLLENRKIMMMMMKNKRDLMDQTQSCFCLSSLQEEGDDNGDGDDDE